MATLRIGSIAPRGGVAAARCSVHPIRQRSLYGGGNRTYASTSTTPGQPSANANTKQNSNANDNIVNIVEVGPRDGLQNESSAKMIPVQVKVELIDRLVEAGLMSVEAGSFVSPKWVPQMAGTAEVLKSITQKPNVHFPVLVPNLRGLSDLQALLASHQEQHPNKQPLTDEIAVFVAATDSFSKANLNCTVSESLQRTELVVRQALEAGLRVRGYVSVVVVCPYEGIVDGKRVREVARRLWEMGCYEVSLGETVGRARPDQVREMVREVGKEVPVGVLAGHFHDTYGTGVANVMAALECGIRTIDASVAGLGGCPYSPGATGNVATEDVVYALQGSKYHVAGSKRGHVGLKDGGAGSKMGTVDLEKLAEVGWWISEVLGRDNASRVGRAILARRRREEEERREGAKSKL